jgi:hypothetical protein
VQPSVEKNDYLEKLLMKPKYTENPSFKEKRKRPRCHNYSQLIVLSSMDKLKKEKYENLLIEQIIEENAKPNYIHSNYLKTKPKAEDEGRSGKRYKSPNRQKFVLLNKHRRSKVNYSLPEASFENFKITHGNFFKQIQGKESKIRYLIES